MESALAELAALPGVREAALLSTCNRVEIYAAIDRDARPRRAGPGARRWPVAPERPRWSSAPHLYERRDAEAVHHLFRVASSLDSLVLGEPQILGQTKQAHESAVAPRQRRRRSSTPASRAPSGWRAGSGAKPAIARNPVSVSSVAIEFARQVFGGFDRRAGAGRRRGQDVRARRPHAARARRHADGHQPYPRAAPTSWPARFGAAVHRLERAGRAALGVADIVIASTGAQRPVLTAELFAAGAAARAAAARSSCIDIAVPRDVEPEAASWTVSIWPTSTILQKVATEHRDERKNEAAEAEAIVAQELGALPQGLARAPAGPTMTALRAHVLGAGRRPRRARTIAAMPGLGRARAARDRWISPRRWPRSCSTRRRWRCSNDDGDRRCLAGRGRAAAVRAGDREPAAPVEGVDGPLIAGGVRGGRGQAFRTRKRLAVDERHRARARL